MEHRYQEVEKRLSFYIWVFLVCSFVGWVYESVWKSLIAGEFVNSGFLYGYYLPVYGFGGMAIIFSLRRLFSKKIMVWKINLMPVVMFVLILLVVSTVEYITSVLLEVIFGVELWNYENDLININGRVSLRNSSILASLGFVFVYVVYPLMRWACLKINKKVTDIIAMMIVAGLSVDLIITLIFMN